MSDRYEIEIKSLLGELTHALALKEQMSALDPRLSLISEHTQLNHYFEGGEVSRLVDACKDLFSENTYTKLEEIARKEKDFSVRTREKNGEVYLVLKASVDEGTSANSISRLEFEEKVPLTLDELDQVLLSVGFEYQAKWSRTREEYAYKDCNVCIDKNAGYGYLVEFEKIVENEDDIEETRAALEEIMNELGVKELEQDRLERMFQFYNQNWQEYYGTDKVFIIE